MTYKILNVLLAINAILVTVDIFLNYGWENTLKTLTIFCFLYVITMIIFEVDAKIDYLIDLDNFMGEISNKDKEDE